MWNIPTQDRLDKIPELYATESTKAEKKLIYLHFFIGGCDWYAAEYDGKDKFFGFAVLGNDYHNAEWGYFSFSELKDINMSFMEIDCELEEHWKVRPAEEIETIRRAQGW